jgi:hypothetical protein
MTLLQDENIAYPQWTEYRKKNGRDPLGMQTGSVNIYQHLLPGISNVTLRMRYYGLYAWLTRTYAKASGDTNPKSWQRVVRRAEALYALIAQRSGSRTGVAGVDWAARALGNPSGTVIDFAAAAEPGSEHYYLKQKWGVYGLAYASQLFEIGVFAEAEGHTIPPRPSFARCRRMSARLTAPTVEADAHEGPRKSSWRTAERTGSVTDSISGLFGN